MNKQDRAELQKALKLLDEARDIIDAIGTAEQDKYDNLSEGLQQSERGQEFEDNVTELTDAVSSLDDAIAAVKTAAE